MTIFGFTWFFLKSNEVLYVYERFIFEECVMCAFKTVFDQTWAVKKL